MVVYLTIQRMVSHILDMWRRESVTYDPWVYRNDILERKHRDNKGI